MDLEDRRMHAACIARFGLAALICSFVAYPSPVSAAAPFKAERPSVERVDFERHVMGLLGRMGCNAGSCHGSFQGRGGFRLSLFGYDPAKDYLAITRDIMGRRIDRVNPDASLLLLKASGQVEHGGGKRFDKGSWPYQLLRDWIVQGLEWKKGSGDVTSLNITPAEYVFTRPGQAGQLKVIASFVGGGSEDITFLSDFRTNDDAVVEVTSSGKLKALRPGDTAVVVSYRGNVVPVRVMVPVQTAPGKPYPAVPESNFVDREVFAKLKRLKIVPSELCSDAEFLRRVSLDTIGTLPSADEVRAFLADKSPDKRSRKIDELLAHPMHAALWATKFCDITGNNTDLLELPQQNKPRLSQMWHAWLRKRIAENMPYDELVRGILCATSRDGLTPEEYLKRVKDFEAATEAGNSQAYADKPSLDLFWRRQQQPPIDQWGQKTAAAFLGVRLECAECHKHPFDRWTQIDYRAYANLFQPVAFGISPESGPVFKAANAERQKAAGGKGNKRTQPAPFREIYIGAPQVGRGKNVRPGNLLRHPDTGAVLPPKALGGPEFAPERGKDPRVALFDWMRRPDNPFFARSFVNRVWGHYFGVGIVQPVDDFSLANPPSNARLLDALASDFVANRYDLRRLERTLLSSRTYQLSSATNATNRLDRNNYSHSYVRPLMAEVMVDMLNAALGASEKFGAEAPPGARAIEIGASRLNNPQVAYAFRIFGRPPRTTACDCERGMEPGLVQRLYFLADGTMTQKLAAPKGRLKTTLDTIKDDAQALEELFLATVSRPPTEKEKARFADYRRSRADRDGAFADLLWALVNTTEFALNH